MEPSVLVYSSHDRSNLIHNDWIVQRALRGNRRLLFLPLSAAVDGEVDCAQQRFNWDSFHWFFEFYRAHGLDAFPFFWHPHLRREDVEALWHALESAAVVILGGGSPRLGMSRYRQLGADFGGDPERFRRTLEGRRSAGLLTVGYSAGTDQLCELMSSASGYGTATPGLGLARRVVATSHFAHGHEPWLAELARAFGPCLVFGLPNDSGLAVSEGRLRSGGTWQVVEAIVDTTWDRPSDHDHVKTRQGVLVQHFYPDGRHWALHNGDRLLRLWSADGAPAGAFVAGCGAPLLDYWRQAETAFATVEEALAGG